MTVYTTVPIRPGKTLVAAFVICAIGYGIARMGWQAGHLYSLVVTGGGIILFGVLMVFVAFRHAVRIARGFLS